MAEAPSVEQLLDYQKKHPSNLFPERSQTPRKVKDTPRSKQLRYFQKQNPGKLFAGPSVTPDTAAERPQNRLVYFQREDPTTSRTDLSDLDRSSTNESPKSSRKNFPRISIDASETSQRSPKMLVPGPVPTPEKSPGTKDREMFKKSGVNLRPQQIPIWSASKPNSIFLYRPTKGDDLQKLKKVVGAIGEWYKGNSQISAITTIDKHPRPLKNWKEDDPHGLSVLFMPRGTLNLKIDVRHHNRYLDIDLKWRLKVKANQGTRVRALKHEIETLEGFPVKQQDLLFRDQCLRNEERLHTYHLNDNEPIELILQPRYDLSVTVQTFWNKDYALQLDRCVRVKEVIGAVLWELFLDKGSKQTLYLVQSLLRQNILCLEYENKVLPNTNALMLYKIQNSCFLNLWPVNHDSNRMSQVIEIKMDYEGRQEFKVSVAPSDTWMIVAMKAFKTTRIPIDVTKIVTSKGPVDLNSSVGFTRTNKHQVTIEVNNEDFDKRSYEFNQVNIRFPFGQKKRLHFNPNDSVADLKNYLACTGFHQAKYYTFFVGMIPLKETTSISGVLLNAEDTIELELEIFPLFVHLQGKEYTILEEHQLTTLTNLQKGVFKQIDPRENPSNVLVHCGEVLPDDLTSIYQTTIGANSAFFIENVPKNYTLEFTRQDHKLFYVTLPRPVNGEIIYDTIKKCKYLYENSKFAVVLLLNWLLTPRAKKGDCPIMLLDPRTKPRRHDPLQPKQIEERIWEEYVKEFPKSKRGKEILDKDGLPVILSPDEQLARRKLKEWPFDTAQPRWVKFPPIPSQTGSTQDKDAKKRIKFEDDLAAEQSRRRRKRRMIDVALQVDLDKEEEQEARRKKKRQQLAHDDNAGQTTRLFRSREEREAFERAQAEALGQIEEEEKEEGEEDEDEEDKDDDEENVEEPTVAPGQPASGSPKTNGDAAPGSPLKNSGQGSPQRNGAEDAQENGAGEGGPDGEDGTPPPTEREVDVSGRQAPTNTGRPAPREVREQQGGRQAPQGGRGAGGTDDQNASNEPETRSIRKPPAGRDAPQSSDRDAPEDTDKDAPQSNGEAPEGTGEEGTGDGPEGNGEAPQGTDNAEPVPDQAPVRSPEDDEEGLTMRPRDIDSSGRQVPTSTGAPGERKPQQKADRRAPQEERGEGLQREAPEEGEGDEDEDGEDPEGLTGAQRLPRKSVAPDTLLAIQKKLRKRRQTLGLVLHTDITESAGKEYEQKDKIVVDHCQDTGEDAETSFVRILYPRRMRVAITEALDAEPAKPKQAKKILKKVKFEDEEADETKGYWKPVLPIVNYHDHPIWEYRPTFAEQVQLKERVAIALEQQRVHDEYLKDKQEQKEKKAKEKAAKKKRASVPKEDKAKYDLVSDEPKDGSQPRERGEGFAPPSEKPKQGAEETDAEGTISLEKTGPLGYNQRKENEKRQWIDVEEIPKYDRRKAREQEKQRAKEAKSQRSQPGTARNGGNNGTPGENQNGNSNRDNGDNNGTPGENQNGNSNRDNGTPAVNNGNTDVDTGNNGGNADVDTGNNGPDNGNNDINGTANDAQ